MVYFKSLLKVLLFCLLVAISPFFTLSTLAVSPSSISVDLSPQNPAPNENVTISLSSYGANLDSVLITWTVNGRTASSGIGQKSFSVTAGVAGSRTQVVARVSLPDGEIDKNITIAPAQMVMLWQATDSYVPPFYRGKALLGQESEVKIVAIPEIKVGGSLINPKNMTYTWQKDFNNIGDAAGYGKNSYTYTTDYLDSTNNVDATATTTDQNYSSENSVDITSVEPKIDMYIDDPSLGTIWSYALPDTYNISGSQTIVAEPYFISPKALWKSNLTFSWFINDLAVSIGSGYHKNLLPIKVPAGSSGVSNIRMKVENTSSLSVSVEKSISVQF